MLKKRNRLRKAKDISKVFSCGRRNVAPHGVFFVYRKDVELNNARIAVVVGKKNLKSAIKRNRIKRVIKAAILTSIDINNISGDIVVGYAKRNKMLLYKEAKEDIDFLVNKLII